MTHISALLRRTLAAGRPAAVVTVEAAFGSTPREPGARMVVTPETTAGTIGGGRLEFQAIDRARAMLAAGEADASMDVPLGPELGQCCGGRVSLSIARADRSTLERIAAEEEASARARPTVLIFGAGHTGRALAAALAPLPLRVRLIDGRPETLGGFPSRSRPSPQRSPKPRCRRRQPARPSSS